jgi:hypothetical protein
VPKKILGIVMLFVVLSGGIWIGLKPSKSFWILYPLETNRQSTHIYDGLRFLGIDESIKAYAAVLNNPIQSDGYADILILSACNSGNNVATAVNSARTRSWELRVQSGDQLKTAIKNGDIFETLSYPKTLTPKLQEYGCAPVKTKDTLTSESMDHLQREVVTLFHAYRKGDRAIVLKNILSSGEPSAVDGGIFRIRLPEEPADTPVIVKVKVNLKHYTLRFQLQKIDE